MNMLRQNRSRLTETVQTGLPTWTPKSGEALILSDDIRACEKFFYRTFGDCAFRVSLFDASGTRLVDALDGAGQSAFPEHLPDVAAQDRSAAFVASDGGLFYVYDNLSRWPTAPDNATFIVVRIEQTWFEGVADAPLTKSEYELLAFLLSGLDVATAAERIGASYDTKRKQVRQIMEKFGVNTQAAMLRDVSLQISAAVLEALLKPEQRSPETALAQDVYGRDIIVHTIAIGGAAEVPIWEFGARRGQPILFFHSMLAPVIFNPEMIRALKDMNLRVLMMPRHFYEGRDGQGPPQAQVMQALSDVVDYLCGEPVICLGESAGCAWAAHFVRRFPHHVSEVVFVATPQADARDQPLGALPRTASLFAEVSAKIRTDDRIIAGLTRVYNSIARVPRLARRTVTFMLRQSPADVATIEDAFDRLHLAQWLKLIANRAARASVDEVAHLQSNWVQDIFALERPMRFVHGMDDPLCPVDDARGMVDAIDGATLTVFPDAGHLVLGQRFQEVLDLLFQARPNGE